MNSLPSVYRRSSTWASTSIPKLDPEDVVVIDAATGVEMPGVDDAGSEGYYSVRRLEYERAISKQIEDNVKRLLSGKYGADGVTARGQPSA